MHHSFSIRSASQHFNQASAEPGSQLVLYKDTEIPPGDNGVVLYFIGRWEEEGGGGEVRRGLHMRSKELLQQLVKENRLCFCGVRLNLAGTSCG